MNSTPRKFLLSFLLLAGGICSACAQYTPPAFYIDEAQKNYHISAQLPGNNLLNIYFARLSDWKGAAGLLRTTATGALQYRQLADSFKNARAQKNLFMKLPSDGEVISIQYSETDNGPAQMAYKNGHYFALKSSMDTLCIIQDAGTYADPIVLSTDSSQSIRQIQYTFTLRDLSDISSLAENTPALTRIGKQIDSVIDAYRQKWHNPDANYKRLAIDINSSSKHPVQVINKGNLFRNLSLNVGFGIELFNGKPCPVMDIGYGYVWNKYKKESGFLAVNYTAYIFPEIPIYQSSSYASIGIEMGTANTTSGFLAQKTAIGMAWFIGNSRYNAVNLPNMFRYYINLPVSRNISTGIDLISNFKTSKAARDQGKAVAIWGVYLKYNF